MLEARAMLSAPVATVQSFALTADTMTVVVSYASDTGIDGSSILTTNLGVTGPQVSGFAETATILSQQPTETVVRYLLRSGVPWLVHDAWAHGTFNLGIPAGSVRSRDGAGIEDTGAGSYWVWFPDTYIEMNSMTVGTSGLSVTATLWTRNPGGEDLQASVRMTRPDGSERIEALATANQNNHRFTIEFNNPDRRGWDYTDGQGAFVFALGEYDGSQLVGFRPTAQYWLWFTNPKVEILSTNVTDSYVDVRARFSDDHGIDLTSFAWTNITVTAGPYTIPPVLDGRSPMGPLVEPQADGSVIATYRRDMYQRSFTNRESGDWTYSVYLSTGRVRDLDGNMTNIGVLRHETHVFTTIGYSGPAELAARADDPTYVTIAVAFFADNLDTTTFGDGDLRMELNGHTYQLSLTSASPQSHGSGPLYSTRYTLQLGAGERLESGTATFYLNAGAVTTSGLPSADSFVGSWWLSFY
jgi:hypothetical protein